MPNQLNEVITDVRVFSDYKLEEREDDSGKKLKFVRGIFQECDVPNQNRRSYPKSLWERITKDPKVMSSMGNRETFGELDHPADGSTELKRTSHIITKLDIQGNYIMGEAEILDTPNGRILETLLRAKTGVGISSRGTGSVVDSEDGSSVVQDDYQYRTFDFVSNPSVVSAYPKPVFESKSIDNNERVDNMAYTISDIKSIEEDANLLSKTIDSASASDKQSINKRLVEHEVTINKIVDSDPTLADYGSRVKSSIGTIIENVGKEISDKDRLKAAISIIESIKSRYMKLKRSSIQEMKDMKMKYGDDYNKPMKKGQKYGKRGMKDKDYDYGMKKKYEMAYQIADELVRRHKLLEKKYNKSLAITEELVSRYRVLNKKYDTSCALAEELVKVSKGMKRKLESSKPASDKTIIEKRRDFQRLHAGQLPRNVKSAKPKDQSVNLMEKLVSRMAVGSV